jgi:hypothetical protein
MRGVRVCTSSLMRPNLEKTDDTSSTVTSRGSPATYTLVLFFSSNQPACSAAVAASLACSRSRQAGNHQHVAENQVHTPGENSGVESIHTGPCCWHLYMLPAWLMQSLQPAYLALLLLLGLLVVASCSWARRCCSWLCSICVPTCCCWVTRCLALQCIPNAGTSMSAAGRCPQCCKDRQLRES